MREREERGESEERGVRGERVREREREGEGGGEGEGEGGGGVEGEEKGDGVS